MCSYFSIKLSFFWLPPWYSNSGFTWQYFQPDWLACKGIHIKMVLIYPLCPEDEADQASDVCQCLPNTAPGQYFPLDLLPPLEVLFWARYRDVSSIFISCQQPARDYQQTFSVKLFGNIIWWKCLENCTELTLMHMFPLLSTQLLYFLLL